MSSGGGDGEASSSPVPGARAARPSESPPAARARRRQLLDGLIADYARRTENNLVWARLLLVTIGLIQIIYIDHAIGLVRVRLIASFVICGLAYAGLLLIRGLLARHLRQALAISVALDPLFVLALFLTSVIWPDASYVGVLHLVEIGVLPIAVVAAGCRFYTYLAVRGIWMGLLCGGALIAVDVERNGHLVPYASLDIIGAAGLFITAAILSLLIAHRSRRLVFDAARLALQNERARAGFRVYVSEQVAREVLDGSDDYISLDGKHRQVAILFCDLRDFTRYANTIEPSLLVLELNGYFEAMVPAVNQHGGVVDKFMGDAIMAVFSREDGAAEPAARAIRAAHDMHRRLAEHNQARAADGRPPLRHGVGIHAGWVVAGNVGTADRMQYTVIGDVVNVAARLEKATKDHGTWLLVSGTAWREAGRGALPAGLPELLPVGPLSLRGASDPMEAYAPPGPEAPAPAVTAPLRPRP